MKAQVAGRDGQRIIEGMPGARLLESPEDAVELIGLCFEHGTQSVLLYAENLTEPFFDLSSGEAGTILQKLRNYHIKLAVVLPSGGTPQTEMFRQMAAEESRGSAFRIFEDKSSAEDWLYGGPKVRDEE
jgi:hypothetical protein